MISQRITDVLHAMAPFSRFVHESAWARRDPDDPALCDFVFGNPHDMPLTGIVTALQQWSTPRNKDWFAYKMNEDAPRAVVAESLREWRGLPFAEEDIFLTNGAFAALSVALAAITNPGDEVVFISPPWFFYEALIVAQGARAVRVPVDPETLDLDLAAIEAALSRRTRAIIINTPHNPTGTIYSPATLERLSALLTAASQRAGHPIYILSDEAYSRIVFDGQTFHSPTEFYPHTLLLYTYGKTLLMPGQRMGYIALPPAMPDHAGLRDALFAAQLVTGYAFPNALLQHALPDLEPLSIDVAQLQEKRDWLAGVLREIGYAVNVPQGTFYLLVRTPWEDDLAFADLLAQHNIYCLPGTVAELPGYIRLSLTANETMIERAIPGFAAAWQQART